MNNFTGCILSLLVSIALPISANVSASEDETLKEKIVDAAQNIDRLPFVDFNALISGRPGDRYTAMRERPTAFHALHTDPRFSFSMYFPEGFLESPDDYRLLVLIHGSGRNAGEYRNAFKEYADRNKFVLLAPLFPVGVYGNGYADGYKFLSEKETRYDLVLLEMVEELSKACSCDFGRFYLYGFSGGGQFAHRFLYVHPEHLKSVSIGAPGLATKINDSSPWFFGTAGFAEKFGTELDLDAIKTVPVQIIVGDQDVRPMPVPNAYKGIVAELVGEYGDNRLENMKVLQDHYAQMGLQTELKVISGVGHEGLKMAPYVMGFFVDVRNRSK